MGITIQVVRAAHRFSLAGLSRGDFELRASVVRQELYSAVTWGLRIEYRQGPESQWVQVDHWNEFNAAPQNPQPTLWGLTDSYSDSSYPRDPLLYPRSQNTSRQVGQYRECRPNNNWSPALWHAISCAVAREFQAGGDIGDFRFEPENEDAKSVSVTAVRS